MIDTQRMVQARFVTNSPGPEFPVTVPLQLADAAPAAPLLLEDPAPHPLGAWRRISGHGQAHVYARLPRIAAP